MRIIKIDGKQGGEDVFKVFVHDDNKYDVAAISYLYNLIVGQHDKAITVEDLSLKKFISLCTVFLYEENNKQYIFIFPAGLTKKSDIIGVRNICRKYYDVIIKDKCFHLPPLPKEGEI